MPGGDSRASFSQRNQHLNPDKNWYGTDHTLLDDQLCAGLEAGGKDSCVADSGGPLVSAKQISGDVVWFQLGIGSFFCLFDE